MKKIFFVIFFFVFSSFVYSQEKLPNISLKDINGKIIDLSTISNGKPIIINFWSSWCAPCKRELNSISEMYQDWVEETDVTIYAVSIDDQRTIDRVKPLVYANNWEYEILYDPNGELKRALGVNSIPFTFLVDCQGNIVWKHNNYNPGDEEELYKKLKEYSKP
jgi:cytochrome c biogenesis protein CcmG/thiol:disulfide interchange protein DsbE